MKTLQLIIIIAFIVTGFKTTPAKSQALAVENASWLISSHLNFGNPSYWGYTIHGDTTINGNIYKKVYQFDCGYNPTFPLHAGLISLYGFVRDYDQKVYAILISSFNDICPINAEYMLFDYTYQVGDTVKLCIADYPAYSECIIDSINENAAPYNQKTFYSHDVKFYKGIGSSKGLFENLNFLIFDYYSVLEAYSTNGIEGLGVITGIDYYKLKNEAIQIFPNPLIKGEKLNIKFAKELIGSSYQILNLYGNILYAGIINTEQIEMPLKGSSDLYFLTITKLNGEKTTKKIIIN